MAELHDILVRPILTEKSAYLTGAQNTYVFEVGLKANKPEIRRSVADVRTLVMRGKEKRSGRFSGRRSNWKKAYVRIAEGQSLNLFDA
jgi:large subunit ribosomal protein L23